jgi:hypothetical protein
MLEMADTQAQPRSIRFGQFEADVRTGELRKDGVKLKFSGQPFQVLAIPVGAAGGGGDTGGAAKAPLTGHVCGCRAQSQYGCKQDPGGAGRSAETPRFVETLPRRGYRFIAPVERESSVEPATEEITRRAQPQSSRQSVVPRWRLMCGVIVLAVGAGFFAYRRTSTHRTVVQRTLTRLTFDDGLQTEPTWTPDARDVAYSSDRGGKFDIWVQQVSGGNPIQVTKGPGQNWQPDWSPDGKYIAYRSEEGDGGTFVIPALGGAGLERKIATFGYRPRWPPDSSQVLFRAHFTDTGFNRFYIAQLDGGPPREVLAEFLAQKK